MPPPSNPRNSRTNYTPTVINPVKKPTTTPKITLPKTPTVKVTPTPTPTPTVSQPKITLSTASEPKLTLPSYSGGFSSYPQRNQTQATANNNYSQEDNFLKKYPQILLVIPLIIIILSKNK